MTVVVVTPPGSFPDIEVVKSHLRVDGDDENDLIDAYIAAVCGHIDGPGGWLGRSLGTQTLELRLHGDAWSACGLERGLELPFGPVQSITSVKYDAAAGDDQTLDPAAYVLLSSDRLALAPGQSFPSVQSAGDAVRIRYVAGQAAPPPAAVAVVLLMLGDLHANRETAVTGTVAGRIPMSTTVENLLSPLRRWPV